MNEFDEKTHTYFIDGKPATGVTTICGMIAKPALIQWAANEACKYIQAVVEKGEPITADIIAEARTAHAQKRDKAGTHGTDTHALVEEYVNKCIEYAGGKPEEVAPESPIHQFSTWAIENVDHFLFSERKMFNKEHFIAGTADFAYISKDGRRMMGDFKTSSGIYGIDYWMQVAGYRFLAESEGDEPYDGSAVVRLGKKGDFEALYRYDYETDKNAFLACRTLYRAQATFKKK